MLIRLSSSGTLKFHGDNTMAQFNRTCAFAFAALKAENAELKVRLGALEQKFK